MKKFITILMVVAFGGLLMGGINNPTGGGGGGGDVSQGSNNVFTADNTFNGPTTFNGATTNNGTSIFNGFVRFNDGGSWSPGGTWTNSAITLLNGVTTNTGTYVFNSNGYRLGNMFVYSSQAAGEAFNVAHQNQTQILQLLTNAELFLYAVKNANYAGFRPFTSNATFVSASTVELSSPAGVGIMGFDNNVTLGSPSFTFNKQIFATNAITIMGDYTGMGKNPRFFLQRTINGAGAEGSWGAFQDSITGNNWILGQNTNVAARLGIRSGATTMYNGTEELGITVGGVAISGTLGVTGNTTVSNITVNGAVNQAMVTQNGVSNMVFDISGANKFKFTLNPVTNCTMSFTNTALVSRAGNVDGQVVIIRWMNPSANVPTLTWDYSNVATNFDGSLTSVFTNMAGASLTGRAVLVWDATAAKWALLGVKEGY